MLKFSAQVFLGVFFTGLILPLEVSTLQLPSSSNIISLISKANAFEVPANQLRSTNTIIRIAPGQATAIHFENGEVIDHFLISDDSRLVYNTDAESGQAQTLILRQITPLTEPGTTNTSSPNILLNTRSPDGTRNLYQFQVQFVKTVSPTERTIRVVKASYSPTTQTLLTSRGTATLLDVRAGLKHILETGQASLDDPNIQSIQLFLNLASQMPLERAASSAKVPWTALVKLAEIGQQLQGDS